MRTFIFLTSLLSFLALASPPQVSPIVADHGYFLLVDPSKFESSTEYPKFQVKEKNGENVLTMTTWGYRLDSCLDRTDEGKAYITRFIDWFENEYYTADDGTVGTLAHYQLFYDRNAKVNPDISGQGLYDPNLRYSCLAVGYGYNIVEVDLPVNYLRYTHDQRGADEMYFNSEAVFIFLSQLGRPSPKLCMQVRVKVVKPSEVTFDSRKNRVEFKDISDFELSYQFGTSCNTKADFSKNK